MAIYHLSAKIISRSAGKSMLAAAAYRSRSKLYDRQLGRSFSYTRRKHVDHCAILLPVGAPAFMSDREELWNFVQKNEKRKDAQLAREIEIALPHELSRADQIRLLKRFLQRCFVSKGIVCDVCIHDNPGNCHAHVLTTMRSVTPTGFGPKRRDMNTTEQLRFWREAWELQTNRFLKLRGRKERIDHRSLITQAATSTPQQQERKIMATTSTPNPVSTLIGSLVQRVTKRVPLNSEVNFITSTAHPYPSEQFRHLFRYFGEMMEMWFPEQKTTVMQDRPCSFYVLQVEGVTLLTVHRDKIQLATGSDLEIELAIQVCIDFGWKRIRLHGSDDFKQRAYAEAIKKGYSPEDIDGVSQPQPILSPSDNGGAKTAYRPHRNPIRRRTV